MDQQLRDAQRAGDDVAVLRYRMRAGEVKREHVALMAHLGHPAASVLVPPKQYTCRKKVSLCIGHFALGIVEARCEGSVQHAKIIAQEMLCKDLDARCKAMGWNAPGENRLWLRLQQEEECLIRLKNGVKGDVLSALLVDVADNITSDVFVSGDIEVIDHVAKGLLAWIDDEHPI